MVGRITLQPIRTWLDQNAHWLLRAMVIAAVLLAVLLIARRPSVIYIGLLVGIGAALILIRQPVIGLAAVIIGGLVVPIGLGTGSESQLNPPMLVILALLGIWILDMVRRHEIRLLPSRTNLPLLIFLVIALLSFGVGQLPWFVVSAAPMRAQLGGLAIFMLSVGALLLASHLVKEQIWLERLTWIFLALAAVYILGRFIPLLGNITGRLFLPSAVGSLFWTWLIALAFSQAVYNRHLRHFWRASLLLLVILTFYIGMTRDLGWTSGWAPALLTLIVILLVGSPRLGLAAVMICILGVLLKPEIITNLLVVGDNSYSAFTRTAAWSILFRIINVSPILGLGPANYYWYTPLYSILGYHVSFNSHNNYIDLVAQLGLAGLACFLWFAAEIGVLGWRVRSRVPEGFAQAYVYGALGGLVGTLVAGMLGDWILPFVYNIGFAGFRASVLAWLFLGGLIALARITHIDWKTSPVAPQP